MIFTFFINISKLKVQNNVITLVTYQLSIEIQVNPSNLVSHTFLHAGHFPLPSVLMRCQQKRQIYKQIQKPYLFKGYTQI